MLLLDQCPEAQSLDVRLLATDIDRAILARARAGIYPEEALDSLPPGFAKRWFQATARPGPGDQPLVEVVPALREAIDFRQLNLAGEWPVRGPFDAIFCRNVAIYFDRPVQDRVWAGFAQLLSPGAHLFIGHSERLSGPAGAMLTTAGITTYRRSG